MAMKRILSLNVHRLSKLHHIHTHAPSTILTSSSPFYQFQHHQHRFSTTTATEEDKPTTFAARYAAASQSSGKVKLIVGDYTTADKTFTANDVQTYADITGDDNPVHNVNDDEAAQAAGFNASICHGMFSGALFSAAVGGAFPGAVLVEKTLKWKKPLYINESLHAHVEVTKVLPRRKLVLCDMKATNGSDELVVEGKVTILVRDLQE